MKKLVLAMGMACAMLGAFGAKMVEPWGGEELACGQVRK